MNGIDANVSGIVPCVPISWTVHRDSHVPEGGGSGSSSTLLSCQSACIDNPECTGFDWVRAESVKCWLHGPWSAGEKLKTHKEVDHYDITRNANCNGKTDAPTYLYLISPLHCVLD